MFATSILVNGRWGEIMTGGVATCPTNGGKDVGGQGCEEIMVERSSV
jgi:hypothetical protein